MNKVLMVSFVLLMVVCGVSFAEDAKTKSVEFGKGTKHTVVMPETWKSTIPESGMRQMEVTVPKAGDDKEDGEISVFMFPSGGGLAGNLPRWTGSFGGQDSLKSQYKVKTAGGVEADIAVLEGPYKGMSKDGPMTTAKENFKMLGAVIITDKGEFYFKLIGPKATVEASKAAFDKAIESFK
ncbi:MAG: hypothetical protein WCT04_26075 [Planctomycetota bacterium]